MHGEGKSIALEPGENLFLAGDDSDTVYFVESGRLEVVHQSPSGEVIVGLLGPNEVVGEITAVVGGRRTATVRASADQPATLRALSAEEYAGWLDGRPIEAQRIADQARRRIDRTRVARVLSNLVGAGHEQIIEDVNELVEWVDLEAGQTLFVQGDIADAAYIVVSGRLRLTSVRDGAVGLDVSVGRGDIVGELGVVEQAPRSAGAVATRDTTLAKLTIEQFATLTAKHPSLMLQIFRTIVTRVMQPQHRPPHAGLIAFAVLDPNADPDVVRSMANEIRRHGETLFLDREQIRQFFRRRGVADADVGSAEHARFDEFLNEADVAHSWVVLETDPTLTTWSRRALRTADRVVLITSEFPNAQEVARIKEFSEVVDGVIDRELWLVQSNQPSVERPRLSQPALLAARPDRVVQLHRTTPSSVERVARLTSGTATGVALSGGGGRGLAHLGALRALKESGVTIDVVAGTSMGSVVAASMALKADADAILEDTAKNFQLAKLIDYTLPIVSFTAAKGLSDALYEACGVMDIRELTLPFSCISTNLTTSKRVIHRSGLLAKAIRASVSIPGVFPPVVEGSDLLVDGGVLENLPITPLYEDAAVNHIIGLDVSPPHGPSAMYDYGQTLGGATALRRQLGRGGRSHPMLTNTVMSSMLLGSSQARRDALDNNMIDVYLSLHLTGVKLLNFDDLRDVAERGYHATIEALAGEGVS